MPQGLQLVTFAKVAISGTVFETVNPISGDSATFFNVPQGSQAYIAEIWATDNLNAAEVSITLLIYYHDLPGISARLATYEYVKQHTKNIVGINTNLTPGDGVAGTAVALNAADNRLHANTDYALLGYTSNLAFGSLTIQGIDTGNLKVGGPVLGLPEHDSQMFVDYARSYNAPLIPIINSNNAGSTNLVGVGTDVCACVVDTR